MTQAPEVPPRAPGGVFALFRVISTVPGRALDRHPEPSAAITPERRMSLKRLPWVFHRGALMCLAKPRAAAKAGTWRPDVECSILLWNIIMEYME